MIIAVTGHIEDSYLIRAIESGMNELSPKPVDNELFEDVLKKLKFIWKYENKMKSSVNSCCKEKGDCNFIIYI